MPIECRSTTYFIGDPDILSKTCKDKQPQEARKPQREQPVAPPADKWLPKFPPIESPQIGTSRPPISYRETAVPNVSNTTMPIGFRGLRPNGTTTLPNDSDKKSVMDQCQPNGIPDLDSLIRSPMCQRQQKFEDLLLFMLPST
jgi:hypothetical protein